MKGSFHEVQVISVDWMHKVNMHGLDSGYNASFSASSRAAVGQSPGLLVFDQSAREFIPAMFRQGSPLPASSYCLL